MILAVVVVGEVVAGVLLGVVVGWGWTELLDAFVLTNGLMGITFGLCGATIAWHRPTNPVGWLLVADALGHATTAFVAPLAQQLADSAAPLVLQRIVATVAPWSWTWSIGLFLPLALLLFPDGRLLSPRWRWVVGGYIVTAPLFGLEMASGPPVPGFPPGYLSLSDSFEALQPLWFATEARNLVAILLAIVALSIKYRRSDEAGRRQLLWLLLASVLVVLFVLPWAFVAGTPIFVLLAIPLVPVAIAIAIVRYQLLDIRLVVSRALTWALLTLVAIAAYAALVALLDSLISSTVGRSAAITVLVALLVAPVLPRLQRLVDQALYGDRRDPARVASRVGEQLSADPAGGLSGVTEAIRSALRLPYVAITADDAPLTTAGTARGRVVVVDLEYAGSIVGQLHVGLRAGESELAAADRNVLVLVGAPLAVALHATRLSDELQASREKLVSTREEERRRLRRDLHDGLGPTLTGVAFTADAAANLVGKDPAKTKELLGTLRADTRTAIADVRRLIDDLRPPALDELGLVGAIRQRADHLTFRADGGPVRIDVVTGPLPELPAALEVALYRIATEALTNLVRHSEASRATLEIRCGRQLELEITDNGSAEGEWQPGVGLGAMAERAAELGGTFSAGPGSQGGLVRATFPLGSLTGEARQSEVNA